MSFLMSNASLALKQKMHTKPLSNALNGKVLPDSSPSVGPGADPGKVNTDIVVCNHDHRTAMGNHMPYEITECYLPRLPPFPQQKLVLDLSISER